MPYPNNSAYSAATHGIARGAVPLPVPAEERSGDLVTRVESALGPPVSGQSSPNDFVVHGVGGAYEAYVPVVKTLPYSRDFGALGISSSGRGRFVVGVAEGHEQQNDSKIRRIGAEQRGSAIPDPT